jgi:hypothetical protein
MVVERSELRLVWPADLFAAEARALLATRYTGDESLGYLLDEAFADGQALELFRSVQPLGCHGGGYAGPSAPGGTHPGVDLVEELIADAEAGRVPQYERRRYWSARRRPVEPPKPLDLAEVKALYADLLGQLSATGYLDGAIGPSCCDARFDWPSEAQRRIVDLLDTDVPVWPLRQPLGPAGELVAVEQTWSQDFFYDVVEAVHDLVARPRRRSWHGFCEEWDYDDFAKPPGQAVYRWKVNELLARSELNLRLADDGDDVGFLVHTVGDDRHRLVTAVLATPDPKDRAEVAHAVGLFRSRTATREDKRSAAVALARVLEDRRDLLKTELLSRDEGALFQIANQFDVRHRRADQRPDYDDAYLDWIFWWYLATVELTNRLLARQP